MSRDTSSATSVDLAATNAVGDGVHWTLPGPADLNVNLVLLEAGHQVGAHGNDAVDVLLIGVAGGGVVVVDEAELPLGPHVLVHIPRGTIRRIVAGPEGLRYLTAHLRRGPLGLTPSR